MSTCRMFLSYMYICKYIEKYKIRCWKWEYKIYNVIMAKQTLEEAKGKKIPAKIFCREDNFLYTLRRKRFQEKHLIKQKFSA